WSSDVCSSDLGVRLLRRARRSAGRARRHGPLGEPGRGTPLPGGAPGAGGHGARGNRRGDCRAVLRGGALLLINETYCRRAAKSCESPAKGYFAGLFVGWTKCK